MLGNIKTNQSKIEVVSVIAYAGGLNEKVFDVKHRSIIMRFASTPQSTGVCYGRLYGSTDNKIWTLIKEISVSGWNLNVQQYNIKFFNYKYGKIQADSRGAGGAGGTEVCAIL